MAIDAPTYDMSIHGSTARGNCGERSMQSQRAARGGAALAAVATGCVRHHAASASVARGGRGRGRAGSGLGFLGAAST